MRESGQGNLFLKCKIYVIVMLCMTVCLTGCNMEQLMGLTGQEIFAESGDAPAERTLSLEEIESKDASQKETLSGKSETESWQLPEGGSFLYENGFSYAKNGLSEEEKIWYHDIELALGYMADSVKLSEAGLQAGLDESRVDKIFQCVLNDHPELFYVEGYSYTKYTRGDKTVAIDFSGTYTQDAETVLARKIEIEQAVDEILVPAMELEDDYEKIKYVYETLIENTDYNVDAEDNQNIYSVFVNQSSVCQGYAKAFQYLMYKLDVECTLVQGIVLETGEGHAWNLVKSNGEYYYVDPTWGDISYQSAGQGAEPIASEETGQDVASGADASNLPGVSYDYLCITARQLFQTHLVKNAADLPQCTAIADNYYVREDALFTQYDEEQLTRLVDRRLAEGKGDIAIRCSSNACYEEMCEALLERQELFAYLAGSGIQSFAYSCNDTQLTLTFFMMTSEG